MLARLRRLTPQGIAGQIVVLVVGAVLIFQIATATVFALSTGQPDAPPWTRGPAVTDRLAEFARVLDQLSGPSRKEAWEAMRATYPTLNLRLIPPGDSSRSAETAPPMTHEERQSLRHLEQVLGRELSPIAVTEPKADARQRDVSVRLRDGAVVTASLPMWQPEPPRPIIFVLLTLGLIATMLVAFLWWAAGALTSPLARFSAAAEEFSLDRAPAPLAENDGPEEVRKASKALNRLQARVRRMVEDRTRMLAAVSHDLGTPITRMRLRAEFIEQEDVRRQMFRDLEQMNRMVHAAVAYLRDGESTAERPLIDLASLLQTICDDFSDMGGDVALEGPDHLLIRANSDDIQRAVTNLVDNALKYGGSAAIRLSTLSGTEIAVDVIDTGPGIAENEKEAMLRPFARGDAARNLDNPSGGFGLGLAIVRAAAEAHGGRLELLNHIPSGLVARLVLPTRIASSSS
jgi:signal transduction histidine kinase